MFGHWTYKLSAVALTLALLHGSALRADDAPDRYLVRLDADSLVAAVERGAVAVPRLAGGKLDLLSESAERYLQTVDEEHDRFLRALFASEPQARVDHEYRILWNGFSVAGINPARVVELPGVAEVRLTDTVEYRPVLDASLEKISAEVLWEEAGGGPLAGDGVKIAVIDSGIDIDNPFFDPTDFSMPAGYPLGATDYTTAKVVAARAYFRSDDPVDIIYDEANPRDHIGHGSHCAGIAAGNLDTIFVANGSEIVVSGVAPRAQLMNYKVFYKAESGSESAHDPELMAAFEDAVADGADVISNSWGGPDTLIDEAPSAEVYLAALDAGVVVVFAAGNEGSGPGSVSHPGVLPRVLTVGSFETGRSYGGKVDVTGPTPVPEELTGLTAVKGTISPSFADDPVGPMPLVSAKLVAKGGMAKIGCAPFEYNVFDGAVALIERGECYFSEKVMHAHMAGAVAVVVYNNIEGASPVTMGGEPVLIPAVQLSNPDGVAVAKWVTENPGAAVEIRDVYEAYPRPEEEWLVSGFSGRGPSDAPLLKPEISAPGRLIFSADAQWLGQEGEPWGLKQGTSMSTPHVAGAAALLRQLHPDLGPDTIQAILVGTAGRDFGELDLDDTYDPHDLGAGRMNLAAASEVKLVAEPPVLSFGEALPGTVYEQRFKVSDLGWSGEPPELIWKHDQEGCWVALELAEGYESALDGELIARAECEQGAPPGEYTGRLMIGAGRSRIAVPYHLRVLPEQDRELLLLDMSFLQVEQTTLIGIYAELAWNAGIDAGLYRVNDDNGPPPLAELLRYATVVAFTGNDQTGFKGWMGDHTLDVLATYTRKGGNVILAGQGPLRGTGHDRIPGVLGAVVDSGFPLIDPETAELIVLDSYRVYPAGSVALFEAPLDIGPETDGQGDLGSVGELLAVLGGGMPEVYVEPFAVMPGDFFAYGGNLGLLFDPYRGYGVYPEVESVTHRAAVLGFGFERVADDSPTATTRQDFFEALYEWVSEEIDLHVTVESTGAHVVVELDTSLADAAIYEVDFGDGSMPVSDTYHTFYYEYGELGTYEITALARAPLGAADVERVEVTLEPEPDAGEHDTETDDFDPWIDQPDPRIRDCACDAVGAGETSLLELLLGAL
jgi:subtilisin family serine protease